MKHRNLIIRAAISLSILSAIIYKLWPSFGEFFDYLTKVTFVDYIYILLLFIGIDLIAAVRIYNLFKAQKDIVIKLVTQFKLFLIGLFFNNFMLGSTGGDIIRAYYLSHHTKHKKTEAVAIVFIDRIIGVFSMIIIAIFFLLLEISNPVLRRYFISLTLFFTVSTGLVLLFFSKRVVSKIPFTNTLLTKIPFRDTLIRIYNAFHLYHSHRGLIVSGFFCSIALQMLAVIQYVIIGKAIGIEIATIHYFAIIPLVFVVNALPISLGGLGVGESACAFLLGLVGVDSNKALALAFLYRITLFTFSLTGGVLYLSPGYKESFKEMEKEVEETEKDIINLT